jgi:hypothetical protein
VQKKEKMKRRREGKYLSRSTTYLVLDSGAYVIRRRREESLSVKSYRKISQETVYETYMSIFLSLYPKKFGYSLGGYSHREGCRAPDRKKLTEERWEIEDNDKEPTGGQVV